MKSRSTPPVSAGERHCPRLVKQQSKIVHGRQLLMAHGNRSGLRMQLDAIDA
jgi:hypothetical protein